MPQARPTLLRPSAATAALSVLLTASQTVRAQQRIWSVQLGTSADDAAYAAIADNSGGVIVAGSTRGDLGGPNAGGSDVWLARFDRHGTRLWLRQFGTDQDDVAYALAPDGAGGFFAAGGTKGNLGGPNAGASDIWVGRFDVNGNQAWLVQAGTTSDESTFGLAADGAGGAFAGAGFKRAHFDESGALLWMRSSPYIWAAAPDGAGGFVAAGPTGIGGWAGRFDSAGQSLWTTPYNPNTASWETQARAVLSDGAGGAFAGGPVVVETIPELAWLAHFDGSEEPTWVHWWNYDLLYALAPDGQGGMFVGGTFLARVGAGGTELWSMPVGGILGLAADERGGVFAVGNTWNGTDNDALVSRYGPCYPNCDDSTTPPTLNALDFACFLNAFAAGSPYANCDGSTTQPSLNVLDFICFLNRFAAGCS